MPFGFGAEQYGAPAAAPSPPPKQQKPQPPVPAVQDPFAEVRARKEQEEMARQVCVYVCVLGLTEPSSCLSFMGIKRRSLASF
jgi:hypothetical protein